MGASRIYWGSPAGRRGRPSSARTAAHAGSVVLLLASAFFVASAWLSPERVSREASHGKPLDELAPVRPSDRLPTQPIRVFEYGFEPSNIVIKAGQVVSWRAVGEEVHTITPEGRKARQVFYAAKRLGSVRHVFKEPGVYHYFCSIHPQMRGTVTVRRKLD